MYAIFFVTIDHMFTVVPGVMSTLYDTKEEAEAALPALRKLYPDRTFFVEKFLLPH